MIINGQPVIIDWNDPCGALLILRPLWLEQQMSGQVQRVRFRTDRSEREVAYNPGGNNLAAIIRSLEYQCALLNGIPNRRVTIGG